VLLPFTDEPGALTLGSEDMPDGSEVVVPFAGVIARSFSWLHASATSAPPRQTKA
jgi:hypothetical protein